MSELDHPAGMTGKWFPPPKLPIAQGRKRLQGHLAYLSGAMEHAPDGGLQWRDRITPVLRTLGVGVLNPCDKPSDYARETPEVGEKLRTARANGDWATLKQIMNPIVHIDLRLVDICSLLIIYLDKDIHTAGSYHELTIAVQQKKPTLIVCKQGKKEIPFWWFGLIPHEFMFDTFADMAAYLHYVNFAEQVDDLGRWLFFNYQKVFGLDGLEMIREEWEKYHAVHSV